jgi:hypothetical protein
MRQKPIEGTIEAILVDLLVIELQQITKDDTSPRQCVARSMVRKPAPPPEPRPFIPGDTFLAGRKSCSYGSAKPVPRHSAGAR